MGEPATPSAARVFAGNGHDYLVCPRLLELDARHGEHPTKWPKCRRGRPCGRNHEHEVELVDPEGHTVNDYFWVSGCRPHEAHEHPTCDLCGRALVHADLDDYTDAKHYVPG